MSKKNNGFNWNYSWPDRRKNQVLRKRIDNRKAYYRIIEAIREMIMGNLTK